MKVYISNECSKRWAPLDIGELHQVYQRRTHSRTRGKGARLNIPRVVDHADGGHARVEVFGHLGVSNVGREDLDDEVGRHLGSTQSTRPGFGAIWMVGPIGRPSSVVPTDPCRIWISFASGPLVTGIWKLVDPPKG